MEITSDKLNFGCGKDIKKEYWNVDIVSLPGVNQTLDLTVFPYPFPNDRFSYVYADNVLEHLNYFIDVMRELHRVLKPGGKLFLRVPHYLSHDAWAHPEHTRAFAIDTFDFFVKGTFRYTVDGRCFNFAFSKIKRKLVFEKGLNPLNWHNYLLEPLFNLFPTFYERSVFRIFQPSFIEAELIK